MSKLTMRHDRMGQQTVKIYEPSNVYPSANLGANVQVGTFSEIGANVVLGDNVRIGAMCFIPEGVVIEQDAWIGPHVVFTNDRFPPSDKSKWESTLIQAGARIGAGCTILPGITVGPGALIGAGSTVTKDVPANETWCGNPAKNMNEPIIKARGKR